MKYKCPSERCDGKVKFENMLCSNCIKEREIYILNLLRIYLIENYLYNEDFMAQYPFKIVEIQRLKHGIRVQGYSNEFLRQFNNKGGTSIDIKQIAKAIEKLKNKNETQYKSLYHLWGRPIETYNCHKSTLYRRINNALIFIANNINLLPVLNTIN